MFRMPLYVGSAWYLQGFDQETTEALLFNATALMRIASASQD
jgi:hypothetical protein